MATGCTATPTWMALLCALALTAPAAATAQTPADTNGPRGTHVSAFGGGANASSQHGAATGVVIGWEVTSRLAFEGRGLWFSAPAGEDAFSADLSAKFALPTAGTAAPYVSAGVGMFRTAFTRYGETLPRFYRDRIAAADVDGRMVFRDLLWSAAVGADLPMTRHLSVRPDLTVLVLTTRSAARLVPVYGAHLTYYFHPREQPQ